jgi:hypothetical protein
MEGVNQNHRGPARVPGFSFPVRLSLSAPPDLLILPPCGPQPPMDEKSDHTALLLQALFACPFGSGGVDFWFASDSPIKVLSAVCAPANFRRLLSPSIDQVSFSFLVIWPMTGRGSVAERLTASLLPSGDVGHRDHAIDYAFHPRPAARLSASNSAQSIATAHLPTLLRCVRFLPLRPRLCARGSGLPCNLRPLFRRESLQPTLAADLAAPGPRSSKELHGQLLICHIRLSLTPFRQKCQRAIDNYRGYG